MRRRCNIRSIVETLSACAPCSPQARQELQAAKRAASAGQCAVMHRHVHAARSMLDLHTHLWGRGR